VFLMCHEVSGLVIQTEVGYTRHELGAILSTPRVNRHMEVALSGVHADMHMISPNIKKSFHNTANLIIQPG
jgi:hypothetical protein